MMNRSAMPMLLVSAVLAVLMSGCAPVSTPIPPTATPIPPTPTDSANPLGFPAFVPIYANAAIVQPLSDGVVEIETTDTFEQVAAFYHKNLPPPGDEEGWEDAIMGGKPGLITQCSATKCEGIAILKKADENGNHEIQITISENADKSVRITVGYFDEFVYNATP
jgi:hypothetical protein